jgi:hypothetical protein
MSFLHHRKLYFANANFEAFSDFPVHFKVDNSAGAFPDLDVYNNLSFHASNGARIPWGCKEFNAGGVSVYKIKVPSIAKSDTDYVYMYYGGDTSTENKAGTCDSAVKLETPMVDEPDTSHIEDWTGVNDGTKKGAGEPVEAAGSIGLCQDFDGSNDYISCGSNASLNPGTNDFTIEVYLARDATGARHELVRKRTASPVQWYDLYINTDNKIYGEIAINYGVSSVTTITSTITITDTNYHHVAITFDRDGNGQIYIDGVATGNAVDISSQAGDLSPASSNLNLGGAGNGTAAPTTAWLNGKYAMARLSTTLRSANWLKAQDKILRTQDYVTFGSQVDQLRAYHVRPEIVLIKGRL